jgi:hypothetical protein
VTRRSFRPLLAAALCLLAAPALHAIGGDDLRACRSEGAIEVRPDGWTKIASPRYDAGEGDPVVTAFAAPPRAANRVYVTNGSVVKLSADGGCTWNVVLRGADNHVPDDAYRPDRFTTLAAPSEGSLWAASYDDAGGVPHPHVYVGSGLGADDAGTPSFTPVDLGLPQVGEPLSLVVPKQEPGAAYLVVEQPPDTTSGGVAQPSRHLYTTVVRQEPPEAAVLGSAWQEVALPTGFGPVAGVATSPRTRTLWAWSGNRYAVTTRADADPATWVTGAVDGPIIDIDVNDLDVVTVVHKSAQGATATLVSGAGAPVGRHGLPVAAASFAHGSRTGVYVASGPGGTFGYDVGVGRWIDITPRGVRGLGDLTFANGRSTRIVLGRTNAALYRFDTYARETFLRPKVIATTFGPPPTPPPPGLVDPVLTPLRQVVTVRPGVVADVPVAFGMTAAATPLDVFFIVDTTASMSAVIKGLQNDIRVIASKLRKDLGGQACFGVGDVKDSIPLYATQVYRTHQRIVCEGPGLPKIGAALAKLTEGGGGDEPEAQLVGLKTTLDPRGQVDPYVAKDQDAGFRPEAYKVIVLISDAAFHQGGGYSTIPKVVNTLRINEVKVVSVVISGNGDTAAARRDMEEVAEGTDTMAPPSGVDCDGDRMRTYVDVGPGEPLVCETDGGTPNLTPAIVGLLLGVKDPGTIAVEVQDGHRAVAPPIRGETSRTTDLKRPSALGFTMPVHCTPAQDGQDLPVGLLPTVRGSAIGLFGQVVVRCRSAAVAPPLPPRPPRPEPLPDPPVVPRPPTVVAAIPQPLNPPAQPPANVNPNAGFSSQEEEQFQVATVTQEDSTEADDALETVELAMSRRGDDPAVAGAAMFGGAAVLSAATAAAYRRRLQRAARPGYVR